jgi:hypothetical protein
MRRNRPINFIRDERISRVSLRFLRSKCNLHIAPLSLRHAAVPLAPSTRPLRARARLSQSRHVHNLVVLTSSLLVLRGKLPLRTPRRGETRDIQIAHVRDVVAASVTKVESESTKETKQP